MKSCSNQNRYTKLCMTHKPVSKWTTNNETKPPGKQESALIAFRIPSNGEKRYTNEQSVHGSPMETLVQRR